MLVADHPEYRMLTYEDTKGSPIYDGRGLLDKSKFDYADLAIIGVAKEKKQIHNEQNDSQNVL